MSEDVARPQLVARKFSNELLADFAGFSCAIGDDGEEEWCDDLNGHLHEYAATDQAEQVSEAWLFYDADGNGVGYTSLSADGLGNRHQKKSPALLAGYRFPHIPALLIGRFAVDSRYHGGSIGRVMIGWVKDQARELRIACRLLTLECQPRNDRAFRFYERNGFREVLPARKTNRIMYYDLAPPAPEE